MRFEAVDRAQITPMPRTRSASRRAGKRRKRRAASRKRAGGRVGKVRVVKGRVNVRVGGYTGVQKIAASHLIRYLPASKLKAAAKKVLSARKGPGKTRKRRKRRRTARSRR